MMKIHDEDFKKREYVEQKFIWVYGMVRI